MESISNSKSSIYGAKSMNSHPLDVELRLMLAGEYDKARQISDQLEECGVDNIPTIAGKSKEEVWVRHRFNRGWFLLQEGKFQEGAQFLENGRFIKVYGGERLNSSAPIYNPTVHNIEGKSIILSLEGGYGDEMIHARYATSLKKIGAKNVHIASCSDLKSVFERVEGVTSVIHRDQTNLVAHDLWLPGFSAGWVCGHTFEDIPSKPYLTAKPESVKVWESLIVSDRSKIGIRWAGNPKFEHQQFRRFPPTFLLNLHKYSKLQIYSLQRDHNLMPIPEGVNDLQHLLISWEDTAAAIMNLDLVITSCTAIAHLAGALGKETWVVVPILPYHTWTKGCPTSKHSPFYGENVTLFRQRKPEEWNDTFQELYAALETRFGLDHINLPDCDKKVERLNLGCGYNKLPGFINVDIQERVEPDQVVDLNKFPWPWIDDKFSHIAVIDILEHLGQAPADFNEVLKEMYRISTAGAIWEIQLPHWRSDSAIDDPTHVRLITPRTFGLFDSKECHDAVARRITNSALSFSTGVDIEVCDVTYVYNEYWLRKLESGDITQGELVISRDTMNNVADVVRILVQVHKPIRYKE